jgi:hypothetical protein
LSLHRRIGPRHVGLVPTTLWSKSIEGCSENSRSHGSTLRAHQHHRHLPRRPTGQVRWPGGMRPPTRWPDRCLVSSSRQHATHRLVP